MSFHILASVLIHSICDHQSLVTCSVVLELLCFPKHLIVKNSSRHCCQQIGTHTMFLFGVPTSHFCHWRESKSGNSLDWYRNWCILFEQYSWTHHSWQLYIRVYYCGNKSQNAYIEHWFTINTMIQIIYVKRILNSMNVTLLNKKTLAVILSPWIKLFFYK